MRASENGFASYDVIGTRVSAVSMQSLCGAVLGWRGDGKNHYVCFADVNSLIQGRDNPAMRQALADADVVSPDGTPLAVVGKLLRRVGVSKTSGPDFLEAFCAASAGTGVRHFFLGGQAGVAATLASTLAARFPGLEIAGTYAPPRFPLTEVQNAELLDAVKSARPDVVWVGLGAPKQEIWMHQNRGQLAGATLLGVGAAFDFSAGTVRRAPKWMQKSGLEWIYRVSQEPRRLFRRYATTVPRFLALVLVQLLWTRSAETDAVNRARN